MHKVSGTPARHWKVRHRTHKHPPGEAAGGQIGQSTAPKNILDLYVQEVVPTAESETYHSI